MTDTDTDTTPPIPTDGTCVKPTIAAVSLGDTVQLQLRLDSDDNGHDSDGDDEQGSNRDDDGPEHSRSHSPVPHASAPPAQQQQQQPQPTPSSAPTPTTDPLSAHVHFHSRVRITSGLRRSRGNHTLGDSSDSDSPSSSISAPLRHHSRNTVPRLPLGERVSRLAAQALQKRRIAAATAAMASSTAASRRFRVRDREYTPFLHAGVSVTYGTGQHGDSEADDADSEDENRSQFDDLHGADASIFGRWPWRALNRLVSCVGVFFVQRGSVHDHFAQWWKWQIESTLCCCCSDSSDDDE